jgi:hypothetical protein
MTLVTRIAFRTEMRAAAVALLEGYAQAASVKLQVYPGRPRSVNPPTAFVDLISEKFEYSNVSWRMRLCTVEVILLHGLFDSKEAVDQADAFSDAFLDYATDALHQAGGNTTLAVVEMTDDPTYVPDWQPPSEQRTYYATRISVEGRAGG